VLIIILIIVIYFTVIKAPADAEASDTASVASGSDLEVAMPSAPPKAFAPITPTTTPVAPMVMGSMPAAYVGMPGMGMPAAGNYYPTPAPTPYLA
jgi:hypothetical protein